MCKDISCITHNNQTKPTKGTLIIFSRCIFSFPLLTFAMASHSSGAIACYEQDLRGKQFG